MEKNADEDLADELQKQIAEIHQSVCKTHPDAALPQTKRLLLRPQPESRQPVNEICT